MWEPNEIIISYTLSYTFKKFDNFSNGINNDKDQNLFEIFKIGKGLFHTNKEINTFNFNNSAYKTICMPYEINGKDLVLENRYDNIFPKNVSLCGTNCTLFYADYEYGRDNISI